MSTRYSDRDIDRTYEPDYDRYSRRSDYAYGSSYSEPYRRGYGRSAAARESDYDRYGREGYYGDRFASRYGSDRYDYDYARSRYSPNEPYYAREDEYDRDRYAYNEPYSRYSERYQSGYRSTQPYGSYGRRGYERRGPEERGWWDRTSDEVASWFGDEEAERRRRIDELRGQYRGRGPRGYKRSDDRIHDDINDRLTDDPYLDASDIDVSVNNCEVTLSGRVDTRLAKRRAEYIAEWVTGVTNVQNNLRVDQESRTADITTGTTTTTATTEAARSKSAGT
jgi:osmotically-inducible protein OsmY